MVGLHRVARWSGWLALLTAAAWPLRATALNPLKPVSQYIQTVWTTDAGLPQTSVYSIAQTPDGYLWVGTEEGLARFDGVQFQAFDRRNTPALPANYIHRLLAMPDGSLWIGTDSGLTHLRSGHWTTWTSEAPAVGGNGGKGAETRLSDDNVEALAAGRNGCVWIGTGRGLNRMCDGEAQVWHVRDGLPGEEVTGLTSDSAGVLWIATNRGLASFDGTLFRTFTTRDGLPSNALTALATATDGSVWMGSAEGRLARESDGVVKAVSARLPRDDINALTFDGDGNLWIGLEKYGLARFHNGDLKMADTSGSLPGHTVDAILADREHSLWVGFFDGGLMQLREGKFTVWGKPEGLSSNVIFSAVEARDGSLWVAAEEGKLNQIAPDGRVRVYTARDGLPSEGIHSLLPGRDGSLWIGSRHGTLTRMRAGRFHVYRDRLAKNAATNALLEDPQGRLWVGTYGAGLARLVNGRFDHVTTSGAVVSLAQSPDGAIWVGTDGDGLLRMKDGRATRYTTANGLLSDHISALLGDPDGTVWVGCTAAGLNRIENGKIASFTQKDGLFDATASDLVEDRIGNLWMGSDHGIFRVAKSDLARFAAGKIATIHSVGYDTADGMRSRETMEGSTNAGSEGWDGRLLYPTLDGLAVAQPARLLASEPLPRPRIESVRLDGRSLPLDGEMQLKPGAFRLSIEYTDISFLAPTRIRFRYRLEGYDHDWIQAGDARTAVFTSLPPGDYAFRVEAARHDGEWSSDEAALRFAVPLPWYRTPLAWFGWVLAGALLAWALVELRTRKLVRGRMELKRLVTERTQQLENEKAELAKARAELQIQATHDSLTGLLNRAAILEHIQRERGRAAREGTVLTVAMADLDHFKQINDSHGHLCGDRVLREAAQRLQNCLRSYDLIGRYGGEEFLILMPGCDPLASPDRLQELVTRIHEARFTDGDGELAVTCSIGVTALRPGCGAATTEDLLRCADDALYRAKTEGRDRVHFDELRQVLTHM
jgi:diguanylate cyclase (GGDEF)-like protein